jgi:hypothetical protein
MIIYRWYPTAPTKGVWAKSKLSFKVSPPTNALFGHVRNCIEIKFMDLGLSQYKKSLQGNHSIVKL